MSVPHSLQPEHHLGLRMAFLSTDLAEITVLTTPTGSTMIRIGSLPMQALPREAQ